MQACVHHHSHSQLATKLPNPSALAKGLSTCVDLSTKFRAAEQSRDRRGECWIVKPIQGTCGLDHRLFLSVGASKGLSALCAPILPESTTRRTW
jgi:hypothetical protein